MDMDLFKWPDDTPGSRTRESHRSKEVSPCSEYTRYTVEGVFKDPWSDLSARFDVETMGILFSNSCFHEPKWSERLGYGMAVIGEDTRLHLHRNGKYIIRRAIDREQAERSYRLVTSLLRPVLIDDRSGKPLWYILRGSITDMKNAPPYLGIIIGWPEQGDNRTGDLNEVFKGARVQDEKILVDVRNSVLDGSFQEDKDGLRRMIERVRGSIAHIHESSLSNEMKALGEISALIWVSKALQEMEDLDLKIPGIDLFSPRAKPFHGSENDYSLTPFTRSKVRRISFLLREF